MANCVWHLKVVDSRGFFTRGEKGKSIQTAVWILKTSAADAKDTQKGFTSVASRRGGGDCFAFRKGKFFCFWRKLSHWDALKKNTFGCWAVTAADSRKRHDVAACPAVWAKRPKWNSVFAPSLRLVVFVALSRISTLGFPSAEATRRGALRANRQTGSSGGVPQQPKNLQKNATYFMGVSWSASSFGNSFDQIL